MKLMFVRHAEPDYKHDSLTLKGHREAQLLSLRLAKLDVRDFYASPLGRAQETARYTLERTHRTAETLPWLAEFRGRMLCDETFLDNQPLLARRMAEAAEMLWRVDIAGCPSSYALDDVLRKAEVDIAAGRVTIDTANQPETYGAGGFASPEALLAWLKANRPPETLVLSHGDFCLPNILADEKGIVGFIDLGQAGCADRWRDLDQGLWSMWANTTGLFGGKARLFDRNALFSALNLPLDEEKLRYYSLLSELCP